MKARKSFTLHTCFAFAVSLFVQFASAQDAPDPKSVFEYLTEKEGAKLTLEMDFTTLLENRKTSTYYPAMLTDENGKSFKVEVKPRGKYRRKKCEMPPIKIKFSKKNLRAESLDTLNEIKISLSCFDDAQSDELVVKEYIAYRMFEHLTQASVRARLIRLTIKDTHVEKSKRSMLCLMVEDEEETVARMKGKVVEQYGISPDSLIMNQAALVSMYEYMIGNTDWEIGMMRNVRLIRSEESAKVLVIPYDFDFSGFVSAPYASPSSESGLKTVRDRFLMANGIKPEALKRATQALRNAKKDLLAMCRSKHLSKDTSTEVMAYLETFFQMIEEKDEVPSTMKVPLMD